MKSKIIAVAGPTASGKSALAMGLCAALDGELVSFDSMQVYRKMDIGTAKPTKSEQETIRHHMIDIMDADRKFSAADFIGAARQAVDDVISREKTAVLCGGTGLYLDSFLVNRDFGELAENKELREELFAYADEHGADRLHDMLKDLDPTAAEKIHKNNVRRVVRAIEICKTSGMTKTEWDKRADSAAPSVDATVIILDFIDREKLYERIDRRVDKMIECGLEEETRYLYSIGALEPSGTAAQAIGYKELLPYIRGECSLEQAADTLKLATRHYAKRQQTWFRQKPGHRLFVDEYESESELLSAAMKLIGADI